MLLSQEAATQFSRYFPSNIRPPVMNLVSKGKIGPWIWQTLLHDHLDTMTSNATEGGSKSEYLRGVPYRHSSSMDGSKTVSTS